MTNQWESAEHANAYLAKAATIPHRTEGESVLLEHVPKTVKRVLNLGTGDGRLLALLMSSPQSQIDLVSLAFAAIKKDTKFQNQLLKGNGIPWGVLMIKRLLVLGLSLANLGSEVVPVHSQSFPTSSQDTTAILNLLRNYGGIENLVRVNNYALVSYLYGQNGGQITLKRQRDKWIIIDGERQGRFCRDVDCLVSKGVPHSTAQQLFERLNKSDEKKKQFQAFLDYWAKKNRNIVPFLGYYANQQWPYSSPEITLSIWPSSTLDKMLAALMNHSFEDLDGLATIKMT